jgi:hypothetical protein
MIVVDASAVLEAPPEQWRNGSPDAALSGVAMEPAHWTIFDDTKQRAACAGRPFCCRQCGRRAIRSQYRRRSADLRTIYRPDAPLEHPRPGKNPPKNKQREV